MFWQFAMKFNCVRLRDIYSTNRRMNTRYSSECLVKSVDRHRYVSNWWRKEVWKCIRTLRNLINGSLSLHYRSILGRRCSCHNSIALSDSYRCGHRSTKQTNSMVDNTTHRHSTCYMCSCRRPSHSSLSDHRTPGPAMFNKTNIASRHQCSPRS